MITILDPASVYALWYYDPDEDPCLCEIFASREKALAEARRRNKEYCDHEAIKENGDFNHEQYDSGDYDYYEVTTYTLVI